jgi:tripartite-type tricarboxylate transporter receptor subunit TctC
MEAGGGADLIARVLADYLAKELNVPVIVENRAGASGLLGASMALKAKPDGYTILLGGDAAMCTGLLQSPNPPYNPFTDFLPICSLGISPSAFGVLSASPFKTLTDFVRAAKDNPGKLSFGFPLLGSSNHLALVLFKRFAKVDIKVIPYKGHPDAIAALLGKHIDMLTLVNAGWRPYLDSGEARVLAATNPIPGTSFKTLKDEGFPQPEFLSVAGYNGFFVPRNTPKPIYDKLVVTFERIAKNPEFIAKQEKVGSVRNYRGPAEFKEFMKDKWIVTSDILEELGMKKYPGNIGF